MNSAEKTPNQSTSGQSSRSDSVSTTDASTDTEGLSKNAPRKKQAPRKRRSPRKRVFDELDKLVCKLEILAKDINASFDGNVKTLKYPEADKMKECITNSCKSSIKYLNIYIDTLTLAISENDKKKPHSSGSEPVIFDRKASYAKEAPAANNTTAPTADNTTTTNEKKEALFQIIDSATTDVNYMVMQATRMIDDMRIDREALGKVLEEMKEYCKRSITHFENVQKITAVSKSLNDDINDIMATLDADVSKS